MVKMTLDGHDGIACYFKPGAVADAEEIINLGIEDQPVTVHLQVVQMTQAEINALPDFEGW